MHRLRSSTSHSAPRWSCESEGNHTLSAGIHQLCKQTEPRSASSPSMTTSGCERSTHYMVNTETKRKTDEPHAPREHGRLGLACQVTPSKLTATRRLSKKVVDLVNRGRMQLEWLKACRRHALHIDRRDTGRSRRARRRCSGMGGRPTRSMRFQTRQRETRGRTARGRASRTNNAPRSGSPLLPKGEMRGWPHVPAAPHTRTQRQGHRMR